MAAYKNKYLSFIIAAIFIVLAAPNQLAFGSHAGFDPNNLISDSEFVDIDNMSAQEVQRFLVEQGNYLKDFTENNRTAAQIIWDASHGNFKSQNLIDFVPTFSIRVDSSTGTVNPKVILVTLQKEQSLISKKTQDDNALRKAMGYGCPDSGSCSSEYADFTKQVEWGSWQLRANYERAKDKGFSDYQAGQTASFSNADGTSTNVTFGNRATASLYRYTPHVYNGNHNFNNLYVNTYNFQAREYEAQAIDWYSSDGYFVYPEIIPGQSTNLFIRVKNTGRITWKQSEVYLGTARPLDRISGFERESGNSSPSGWVSPNRVKMMQSSVAPGETASFDFWMRASANQAPGTYSENFELVADGITWFPRPLGIYWEIKVLSLADQYKAQVVEWSSTSGSFTYPTISRGSAGTNLVIKLKNTGKTTWTKGIVNLGTARERDRTPGFLRESLNGSASGWVAPNRITMQESQVVPGQTATFSFWAAASSDKPTGSYREYFAPVADGITWFSEDLGIYWDVKVE